MRSWRQKIPCKDGFPSSGTWSNIGAVRLKASLASARSIEVKTWMEQTQGMGGDEEGHRIRAEMEALRGWWDFLEGALTQMTNFVIDLKDKQDTGGGGTAPQAIPQACFASWLGLLTHMRTAGVCLVGFCQEMKGAPLELGRHSFQGLDLCVAWVWTNMPRPPTSVSQVCSTGCASSKNWSFTSRT
jgi:hypothetical protein